MSIFLKSERKDPKEIFLLIMKIEFLSTNLEIISVQVLAMVVQTTTSLLMVTEYMSQEIINILTVMEMPIQITQMKVLHIMVSFLLLITFHIKME